MDESTVVKTIIFCIQKEHHIHISLRKRITLTRFTDVIESAGNLLLLLSEESIVISFVLLKKKFNIQIVHFFMNKYLKKFPL